MGVEYVADGKVIIDTKLDDSGIDSGLKSMQSKLSSAGGKMKKLGGKMTKSLTTPILAMGTGAVMMAAKFDDSMANVQKISGATGKDFDNLRNKAIELGSTTAFSAKKNWSVVKKLAA